MADWQPGAPRSELVRRAGLLSAIRAFFADRGVMEVSLPVLGGAGVPDVHLENLSIAVNDRTLFLQTSPEYAMKRLLAAGSGPIYSLGPAFRGSESGRRHNPEFTMLEWYRPGFDLGQLVSEVEALLRHLGVGAQPALADTPAFAGVSYAELFEGRFGINPHRATLLELDDLARTAFPDFRSHIAACSDQGTRADLLDLMFSQGIEPTLVSPTFVLDFPVCQAALAQTGKSQGGDAVARRFEFFWQGVELANGYLELSDPAMLRERFLISNHLRATRGLPTVALDEKFLAAMPHMPPASGVAMGVERLHMLLAGRSTIGEVMAFGLDRL